MIPARLETDVPMLVGRLASRGRWALRLAVGLERAARLERVVGAWRRPSCRQGWSRVRLGVAERWGEWGGGAGGARTHDRRIMRRPDDAHYGSYLRLRSQPTLPHLLHETW